MRFGCPACGIGAGKSASRDSISALLSFMSAKLRCQAEKPRFLGVTLCSPLFRAVDSRPKVCRHLRSISGARFSRGSSLRWRHPPQNLVRCGRVTHFQTQITESIPGINKQESLGVAGPLSPNRNSLKPLLFKGIVSHTSVAFQRICSTDGEPRHRHKFETETQGIMLQPEAASRL